MVLHHEDGDNVIGFGSRDQSSDLYVLPTPCVLNNVALISTLRDDDASIWHRRLAHINMKDLPEVHNQVHDVPKTKVLSEKCRACEIGKAHKLPFTVKFKTTSTIREIVLSDIVGKLTISFPDRFQYVCTFMHDYSRYTYLAFFTRRSEVSEAFKTIARKFRHLKTENPCLKWAPNGISILH